MLQQSFFISAITLMIVVSSFSLSAQSAEDLAYWAASPNSGTNATPTSIAGSDLATWSFTAPTADNEAIIKTPEGVLWPTTTDQLSALMMALAPTNRFLVYYHGVSGPEVLAVWVF